jgi:hypothetical protein
VLCEGHYFDTCVKKSQFTDAGMPLDERQPASKPVQSARSQKCLSRGQESTFMGTRIANRAVVAIQIMSRVAIIIAMGMILAVIGTSIYGMLGITH